jgi:arsenite-transporting ATPase
MLGLANQHLLVNGVFRASDLSDPVALSIEQQGKQALSDMPAVLVDLPRDEVLLQPIEMMGLDALRSLLGANRSPPISAHSDLAPWATDDFLPISRLIDDLAAEGKGLIMVMGKGGVGKTTIAAAIAVGLVKRGHRVLLTTTDPAAHLAMTVTEVLPGLRIDRIDPKVETERYIAKVMAQRGGSLDEQGKALLREDLASPCTEEVAVFHAFSHIVAEARSAFVVLDTAPTGHSLLLMDATGAYHRQMERQSALTNLPGRITTPLMRLQNSHYTRIVLVTLPETTPVSQASALQDDLRRAAIEPFAWVINKSLYAAGARDPLLRQRLQVEQRQIARVRGSLARRLYMVPWQSTPPIGAAALERLAQQVAVPADCIQLSAGERAVSE